MKNLKETNMMELYSQRMGSAAEPLGIDPAFSSVMYEIMIKSITEFLAVVKPIGEDGAKAAIVIKDIMDEDSFGMAGLITFHKGEGDMPGNYSLEFTFDREDIDGAVIYTLQDDRFMQVVGRVAINLHGLEFDPERHVYNIFYMCAKVLKEWLDANTEAISVELPGYFVASVGIEDDEKIFSIVPDGAMKRLIKDDASLEK